MAKKRVTYIDGIFVKYYLYIVTNKMRGVLYIGVTNDIIRRIWEHKEALVECFTKRYKLNKLVYMEEYTNPI